MTSPAFPAGLDALSNPGPTTETDDAGYELDIVVARLQNCIMAIENKLGIGTGGPPASAAVLRRTATGSSGWGQVVDGDVSPGTLSATSIGPNQVSVRRLLYAHGADVYTGSSLGATLSADLFASQSFTVDSTSSVIGVSAYGSVMAVSTTVNAPAQIRVHVDTTVIPLGGNQLAVASGQFAVSGAGTVWVTGLSAGAHGVKVSILAGPAALSALYFRPATQPYVEFAGVSVVELKR